MQRHTTVAAAAAALVLAAAGCGGDDDTTAATTATSTTTPAVTGSSAAPAVQAVTGGETRLEIDDGALRALEAVGVAVEPAGEARRRGVGIVFPVTGGRAADDGRSGRIEHTGGLRFTAAGQRLQADDLILDLSDGRVSGEVTGKRVTLLDLALEPADLTVTDTRITAGGTDAELAPDLTGLLSERLSLPGLPDGIKLGEARFAFERR